MKILYVLPKFLPSIGGVENHVLEVSTRLVKRGHEINIFTSNLLSFDYNSIYDKTIENYNGILINRFKTYKLFPLPRHLGYHSFELFRQLIKSNSFDIIHSHSYGGFPLTYCSIIKRLKKFNHVITTHSEPGSQSIKKALFDAFYIKNFLICDALIVVTKIEYNHYIRYGFNKRKIKFIPNGIDVQFYSLKRNVKFKELEGKNYILYGGSIDTTYKGLDVLIISFKNLLQKYNDIFLVIAGFPTKETFKIISMIKKLKLEKNVFIYFNLNKEDLASLLSHCTFLVLPSRIESFGLVILEAFASSKTVVASNAGGIKDIVKDNFNGLLFKANDSSDLHNKMITLLKNDNLRSELEKNAYKTSLSYDWDIIVKQIESLYEKIVS